MLSESLGHSSVERTLEVLKNGRKNLRMKLKIILGSIELTEDEIKAALSINGPRGSVVPKLAALVSTELTSMALEGEMGEDIQSVAMEESNHKFVEDKKDKCAICNGGEPDAVLTLPSKKKLKVHVGCKNSDS
jgi:hypothetical protein